MTASSISRKKQSDKPANERAQRERDIAQKAINAKKDLLDKSISDGVFTRWLRLQQWLPKGDNWELTPAIWLASWKKMSAPSCAR